MAEKRKKQGLRAAALAGSPLEETLLLCPKCQVVVIALAAGAVIAIIIAVIAIHAQAIRIGSRQQRHASRCWRRKSNRYGCWFMHVVFSGCKNANFWVKRNLYLKVYIAGDKVYTFILAGLYYYSNLFPQLEPSYSC